MSDKLIVNWDDYNNTVEKLAIQIEESNYKPTILIGNYERRCAYD